MKTNPILICGPSGSGKSTLVKYLISNKNCEKIVTVTTRPMRSREVEGIDYYFADNELYEQLVRDGRFFMDNSFLNARYGTLISEVERIINKGKNPIMETYAPTVIQFKGRYPETKAIFLYPEDPELLKFRMLSRGDSPDLVERRMIAVQQEMEYFNKNPQIFDGKILLRNQPVEELASELINAVGIDNFNQEHDIH